MYGFLLFVQTLTAGVTLAIIHKWFGILLDGVGQTHTVPPGEIALLVAAFGVGQAAFWFRVTSVRLPAARKLVLAHVVIFLGKIGFIFGGALFSLVFLRHMPSLEAQHYSAGLVFKGAVMIASIFSLFCFTLELERLGAALQTVPPKPERAPR